MRRFLLVPLASIALFAAGCGDEETTAETTAPAATTSTPAASADGGVAIGMKGLAFDPKDVTVKVGQKITWTNNEDIPHNVVAESGADFQSDTFGKDKTFEFTPEKPGTIKYVCTIHPGMDGTLTVEG